MTKYLILSLFLLFSTLSYAQSQDIYAFKEPAKQTEFDTLLKDLRCLVCQGQDLHDSQTQFAETLRKQIHQWVLEGKSEKEIMNILIDRYGESISFEPSLQRSTYILWITPFALFFTVILILLFTISKRKKH
jgi:cytochrome c-type biogenesis protein CcmH